MASIVFTLEDGTTITTPLGVDIITVGRASDSIVQLACPSVSKHHATIKPREDGYYVQDLNSSNGTRLNGAEIEEALLEDGDRVSFGDIQSVFYATDEIPVAPVAEPEPAPKPVRIQPEPEVVVPLVQAAAPVTGIPHGAGYYNPPSPYRRRQPVNEGSGCMTAVVLMVLFGGAFIIGLSLRHYSQTGGFLPNDLVEHFFKKVNGVRLVIPDDDAKK